MPEWNPIQHTFTGGEVSPRMIMRTDIKPYAESLLEMLNFYPTLQGTAERTPGTRFLRDIGERRNVRILPFLDIDDEPALVQLTNGFATVYKNIANSPVVNNSWQVPVLAGYAQLLENPDFDFGMAGWIYLPWDNSVQRGVRWVAPGYAHMANFHDVSRPQYQIDTELRQQIEVVDPSVEILFDLKAMIDYVGPSVESHQLRVGIGTVPNGGDIADFVITGDKGFVYDQTTTFALPPAYVGPLYLTMLVQVSLAPTSNYDRVDYFVDHSYIFVASGSPGSEDTIESPYLEDELEDVHFVQSPYGNKELVMVHPNHPPQKLYSTGIWVLEDIPFTNEPVEWATSGYPSTCTACQGRLVLCGTPGFPERTWATEPGLWDTFTLAPADPADSLDFTTIYRSPIQWCSGHKELLIGAVNIEYVAKSAEGLLQPADIDVRPHSTHGGGHVQPAGFGPHVMFAAEHGTRVRAAQYNRDEDGWIAPDMTLLADHITEIGIRRMVRMRNPHQLLVVLLNNGTIAYLHRDDSVDTHGWSRYEVGGEITDITVLSNSQGLDILYMTVDRVVEGIKYTYIEAVVNWSQEFSWDYTMSNVAVVNPIPSNLLLGLEHLEGYTVQVVADKEYRGAFLVQSGQVQLTNPDNSPLAVTTALVGIAQQSKLKTLPPTVTEEVGGAGSKKRYSDIIVRTLASSRPIINGERPPARNPSTLMDQSQAPDGLTDNKIANLGWGDYAFITVEEDLPLRCQVAGIFGKLASKKL